MLGIPTIIRRMGKPEHSLSPRGARAMVFNTSRTRGSTCPNSPAAGRVGHPCRNPPRFQIAYPALG